MELQIKSFTFPLDGEVHEVKVSKDFGVMSVAIIEPPMPFAQPVFLP